MKTNKLPSPLSLLALLMFALGVSSCSAEMLNEELSANATLFLNTNLNTLGLNTTSAANESSISTLRVLVYEVLGTSGENTVYGEVIGNSTLNRNNLPSGEDVTLRVEFKKRNQVEAFLVANEEASWNLSNKEYTVADLKKLTIRYSENVIAPFKMFEKTGIFSGQSDTSRKVFLVRNVARVDVKLFCKAADMPQLPKGGLLQLTQARIMNMAKTTQLGEAIEEYTFGKGEYVNGSVITFTENENYKTTYDSKGVFTGFTTLGSDKESGSLTFYVPEHFVKTASTHTYMAIEGKHYPSGNSSGKGFNVAYTLPIGEVVTTDKINGSVPFDANDLKITRNFKYEMTAQFKKIEQISDVVVSVKEWVKQPIDGTIESDNSEYQLNVSTLHATIAQGSAVPTLVQFWSNQDSSKVRVLESGMVRKKGEEVNTSFNVNSTFVTLADVDGQSKRPESLWFNNTAVDGEAYKSWGHLKLKLRDDVQDVTIGDVYTITLAAGALRRTIKIEITSVEMKEEESN